MTRDWTEVAEAIRALPKVEIHLHLEGAIPLAALWELIRKYGATGEVASMLELEERFRYRDFPHFLETWTWKNGFLREYEDFTFVAGEVAADLARQNIRYVEAFHSPGDFAVLHGLEVGRITEAVRKGLDQQKDVEVRLIADLTRDFGPERGRAWLREIAGGGRPAVIGIGIGGSEHAFPPEPYRQVYEEARRLGLRTTAHAGEAAGPESIWGAIRALRVDRIGHGTRATEDPDLVEYLRAWKLPVEMCPISNERTGVVASLKEHPIRPFFDAGLLVSVNTDDPKMFGTSLEKEYLRLMTELSFSLAEIRALIGNAITSSWAEESTKRRLRDALEGTDIESPS